MTQDSSPKTKQFRQENARRYECIKEELLVAPVKTRPEIFEEKNIIVVVDEQQVVGQTAEVSFAVQNFGTDREVAIAKTEWTPHIDKCSNFIDLFDWFKTRGWPVDYNARTSEKEYYSAGSGRKGKRHKKNIQEHETMCRTAKRRKMRNVLVPEPPPPEPTKKVKFHHVETIPPNHVPNKYLVKTQHSHVHTYDLTNDDSLQDEEEDDVVMLTPVSASSCSQSSSQTSFVDGGNSQETATSGQGPISPTTSATSAIGSNLRQKQVHDRKMRLQYMNFVMERADITLLDYLKKSDFSLLITQFKCILFQVLFTLHVSQQEYDFVHNDLHLCNIMLKEVRRPSDVLHSVFSYEHICWLCPFDLFPFLVKLLDFGNSRIKVPNGEILCNEKTPVLCTFDPFRDKLQFSRQFMRVQIRWEGHPSEATLSEFRNFKKKLYNEYCYTPFELLCDPFFHSLTCDLGDLNIDLDKYKDYIYGDVNNLSDSRSKEDVLKVKNKRNSEGSTLLLTTQHKASFQAGEVGTAKRQPPRRAKA
ncbi:hypothetical protein AKO1_015344 [Acrasis kona]|uniref:Protein kinase domain-containing protein n=1 Tax=Acrasis kona TaxID=1008807 RepID=A0AAW2ZFH1_9EUKA